MIIAVVEVWLMFQGILYFSSNNLLVMKTISLVIPVFLTWKNIAHNEQPFQAQHWAWGQLKIVSNASGGIHLSLPGPSYWKLSGTSSVKSVTSHKDLEMVSDVGPKILACFLTI